MKLKQIISLILTIILTSNCAGIPGKNVKLEDYPEINDEEVRKIDLTIKNSTRYITQDEIKNSANLDYYFSLKAIDEFKKNKINKFNNVNSKCALDLNFKVRNNFAPICFLNYYISGFTLTIIPYYCQQTYTAHATLISTQDNRILKTYDLKDKVHEVWSLLLLLAAIPIKSLRDIPAPEGAKHQTETKLSTALTRQILRDAATFKECQK